MSRSISIVTIAFIAAVGCSAEDAVATGDDATTVDTAIEDETSAAEDAEIDSATGIDSTGIDSGVVDSVIADTLTADTVIVDTTIDTADAVSDAMMDTVVIEDADATPVVDTTVADTSPSDSPPSTGGCAAQKIVWAKRQGSAFSSSGSFRGYDVAVHDDGSSTIAGVITEVVDFAIGTPYQTRFVAQISGWAFVGHFSVDGEFRWGTAWPTRARAVRIAALSDGGMLVAGDFSGSITLDDGLPSKVVLTSSGTSDRDAFVARLTSTGRVTWAKRIGGPMDDDVTGLALASDGSFAIVGRTNASGATGMGSITFAVGEPEETTLTATGMGDRDYVAKYSSAGKLLWARTGGGPGNNDLPSGVAIAPSGDVVMTGEFEGSATFTGGTTTAKTVTSAPSVIGMFVTAYDASGTVQWATGTAGNATRSSALNITSTGGIVVLGAANDGATFGGGVSLPAGGAFLASYSAAGALTNLLRTGNHQPSAFTLTATGSALIAGRYYFKGEFAIGTGPATTLTTPSGEYDGYYACASSPSAPSTAGPLSWVHTILGTADGNPAAVKRLPGGDLLVLGNFKGEMTIAKGTTSEVTLKSLASPSDVYLARVSP